MFLNLKTLINSQKYEYLIISLRDIQKALDPYSQIHGL